MTRGIWELSADLNAQRPADHPISPSTITNMPRRHDTSCQHAAAFLRRLERPPEDFVAEPRPGTAGVPLPDADPAHRLRWDLPALYDALDERRVDPGRDMGTHGRTPALHAEPADRAAHGEVRDEHAARDADLSGSRPSGGRLRPTRRVVTGLAS